MNAIFEALARASVFGLAALAVALIAQFALSKRVPASWRAWIWRLALLQSAFALLPLAPVRWRVLAPPPRAATPTAIVAPINQADEFASAENLNAPPLESPVVAPDEIAPIENAPIEIAPIENAPIVPVVRARAAPFDWRALVLAIYALGILFQFAQLARGQRQLRRVLRSCAPGEDAVLTARLNVLTARLKLKNAPKLLICESGSPFLTGVWRPRIVLPRALCEAESAQLDAILAHELAHQKRRDLIWSGATWLLQTLLWFHPLSWVSRRFHGLETECACDELALRLAPIAPQSYGALLLNSMNNSKFSSPLAAGTCDTLFALKTRLLRLNNTPKSPRKLAKLAFALALLLSCGAVVPLKLVARAGDAPANSPGAPVSWPAGRITEPQYDARAVVQGIVISRATGKPLAGVPIILMAPYRIKEKRDRTRPPIQRYQGVVTDARGYYRFNTIGGGLHSLNIAGLVFNSPEFSGSSAELLYQFNLKNGRLRSFKTAIDEDFARPNRDRLMVRISEVAGRGSAVVQGVAVSKQTGKPLAGVPMILAYGKSSQQWTTDARGYFHFNARPGRYILRVKNGAPIQTFDLAKEQKRDFNLALGELPARDVADVAVVPSASKKAGSAVVQGVVTSKRTGKPLAGVPMILIPNPAQRKPANKVSFSRWKPLSIVVWPTRPINKANFNPDLRARQETVTDARGYFRFNAKGGEFHLLSDGQISVDSPNITTISAKTIAAITVKGGQKQEHNFALDKTFKKPDNSRISTQASKTRSADNAVVQGVVTSKVTKKPVAGVPMILFAPWSGKTSKSGSPSGTPSYQETTTDARGYFRFNTAGGGNHTLGVDGIVEMVEGKMRFLAYRIYDFKLQNGMKRDFKLELGQAGPTTRRNVDESITGGAVVQGIVTSKQTKKPLAGVTMILLAGNARMTPRKDALADISNPQRTATDARGYFRFNAPGELHSLLIDGKVAVNAGKVSGFSAQQIYVVPLKSAEMLNYGIELDEARSKAATAPVAATNAGSASGQIVDENKRPLAGATAILYRIFDKGSPIGTETKSDANGRFRFEGLQPGAQFSINANKKGYAYGGSPVQIVEAGKNATFTVSLQAATAALRGVVIGEDGQPARNYTVQITHVFVADTKTDAQGRFLFPQALPGQNAVRVLTPKGDNGWGTFNVGGGEQNARIRLTKSVSDARFPHVRPTPKTMSDATRALIGKTAPEIKAARWIGGKTKSLQSLRGKVVLLVFDNFAGGNQDPWNDLARSTSGRLEIVGVQVNSGALVIPAARMNEIAANAAFPIALDAERDDGNNLGGQTFSEYGMGVTGKHGYAIIGRDGKIVEAGDSLLNAFKFADRQ